MPLILAFDTSGPHCAAALMLGDTVLSAAVEAMPKGQAERLVDLLDGLLRANRRDWSELAAVACGIGPGNSTGVRIAVAAARALALALRIPAIGVSRFEAEALGQPLPCLVALDARRGETWVQRFGDGAVAPCLLAQGVALPRAGCAAVVRDAEVAGEPQDRIARVSAARMADSLPVRIARIAAGRLDQPQPRPSPLYLRGPDAAPPREAPPAILG